MNNPRKNRYAFRPSLGEASLEERVVLNAAHSAHAAVAAAQGTTSAFSITARQLHSAYAAQYKAAFNDLRQFINTQTAILYQNGTPTAQKLADFNAMVNGAVNATAFRLSSQAALLPGSSSRLVPNIQSQLLGSGRSGLLGRIQNLAFTSRNTNSPTALENAINRQLNNAFTTGHGQLANFFNTTNFNRLSVDQTTGQRIPLGQFIGNQVLSQFGNTLGSLGNTFPTLAGNLFANGATPTTAALNAFNQQGLNALGTAAFQLGNNLALFPGASSALGTQLQSALFASGTNPATGQPFNSLFNGLQSLPFNSFTPGTFNTAAQTAFNTSFGNIASPLSTFFGLPTTTGTNGTSNFNLPTGQFTNVFGSQFAGNNFNSGFNNGFGSGFIGFGTAPTTTTGTGFNSNFGTGFSNFINGINTNLGFTMPNLSTGSTSTAGSTGFGTVGTGGTFGLGTPQNGAIGNTGNLGGSSGFFNGTSGGSSGFFNGTSGPSSSFGLTSGGSPFSNGAGGFFLGSGASGGTTGTTSSTGSTTSSGSSNGSSNGTSFTV